MNSYIGSDAVMLSGVSALVTGPAEEIRLPRKTFSATVFAAGGGQCSASVEVWAGPVPDIGFATVVATLAPKGVGKGVDFTPIVETHLRWYWMRVTALSAGATVTGYVGV